MASRVGEWAWQPHDLPAGGPSRRKSSLRRRSLTSFIGRERELRDLADLVERETPLISIVGAPGMGKTRLAMRVAMGLDPGSAVFCDLRGVETPEGMVAKVAESLDARVETGADLAALIRLVARLLNAQDRTLVVLDNFEQLVPGGLEPLLGWLGEAPACTFLVTSRCRLGIAGDYPVELTPLSVTASADQPSEGARLFIDRARLAEPTFDTRPSPAFETVARRLQGVPLAIELAASQMRRLSQRELLEVLTREPTILLEDTSRMVEPQHRSLRSAIETSWSALRPCERAALSQLAVCRQGFDQNMASAVVAPLESTDESPLAEIICTLREASLLHPVASTAGVLRWDMYEAIREYALEFPREGAEERHMAWCIELGQQLLTQVSTPEEAAARSRLAEELENFNAAFEYCAHAETRNPGSLADMALVLSGAYRTSRPGLAIVPLTQAIEMVGDDPHPRRIELLVARGVCHREIGSLPQAQRDFSEARRLAGGETHPELDLEEGLLAFHQGDLSAVKARLAPWAERCSVAGVAGRAHLYLGITLSVGLQDSAAGLHFCKALSRAEQTGDLGRELHIRIWAAVHRIYFQEAVTQDELHALVVRSRQFNDVDAEILAEQALGIFLLDQGELEEARRHFDRALDRGQSTGRERRVLYVSLWLRAIDELERRSPPAPASVNEDATRDFCHVADRRAEAIWLFQSSGRLARMGMFDRARATLERGINVCAPSGDRALQVLARLQGARVDIAESKESKRTGNPSRAAALRRNANAAIEAVRGHAQTVLSRSVEARWAERMLQRELAEADAACIRLRVRADGGGFQLNNHPPVAFLKGSLLGEALFTLAQKHTSDPGCPVGLAEFRARCWPGQRLSDRVMSQRLRQIIKRMRAAGLIEIVLHSRSGYFLDSEVSVEIVDSSTEMRSR